MKHLLANRPELINLQGQQLTSSHDIAPPNFKSLMDNEISRYKKKGLTNLLVAATIAASYLYFAPIVIKKVWPMILYLQKLYEIEDWKLALTVIVGWNAFLIIVTQLIMWAVYHAEHPAIEKYKIGRQPWPWQENREEWITLVKRSILNTSLNAFVTSPAVFITSVWLNNWTVEVAFSIEELPDWPRFTANLIFCMMCYDALNHVFHRLLHWGPIYPYVHKVHHTYVHTVGVSTGYAHPFEAISSGILPAAFGGILLKGHMHITTGLALSFIIIVDALD